MNADAIVDSHVHLWNPARFRYSWLDGMPALQRPFGPLDYASAGAATLVGKIIFVESGCDPAQSLAEVDWVSSLAKSDPRLKGIVAHASLEKGEAARADLRLLAARPLVKGIRRNLQSKPESQFCLRPEFIAGVSLLAEFGFTFDLCIRSAQLPAVTELVRRVPQVTFILDHFGKPNVRERQFEPWASDLQALAALPNVVCKVSGLTTEADGNNWQPADLKFYFNRTLEYFGCDRILFGSDWPVATLATDFERWRHTVLDLLPSASDATQKQLFQTNSERIYHL
jgi:L-fuconolactonase